jgi:hypothetical protein
MIDGARSNRTARAQVRRRGVGFVTALAAWLVVAGAAASAAQEAKLVGFRLLNAKNIVSGGDPVIVVLVFDRNAAAAPLIKSSNLDVVPVAARPVFNESKKMAVVKLPTKAVPVAKATSLTATWRGVKKTLLVTVLPALRAPRLRQPAPGIYCNPLRAGPNFSWGGGSGATEFRWCLQRFDDAGPCRNRHPTALMIKPSGAGYRLRRFMPHHYGIKWKWYVVACAKGNCVNSETSRILYVQLPPAKLVAPANHARSVSRQPAFIWRPVDGATGYVLHVQQGKQPEQTFTVRGNALRYQPSRAFAAASRLRWWVAACGRAVGCTKQSSPDRLWDFQLR